MHGVFFKQKIEERLQHGSYCSATSAEIADGSGQDVMFGHAIRMARLVAHPLFHHVGSSFRVLLARSDGLDGGAKGMLFRLEVQPAQYRVAEEKLVQPLRVRGNRDVKSQAKVVIDGVINVTALVEEAEASGERRFAVNIPRAEKQPEAYFKGFFLLTELIETAFQHLD